MTEPRVLPSEEVVAKLRIATKANGFDALVAMSPENVAYAAGVAPPSQRTVRARLAACIVPADGETELIAVGVDAGVVQERAQVDVITAYEEFVEDPVQVIAASLINRGLEGGRIGFETSYVSADAFAGLRSALPRTELASADVVLEEARAIKTPGEIDAIRRIGRAAERIAGEAVALVGAGESERELARLIEERYTEAGGDRLDMLVVGSGPRSALPNAPASGRCFVPDDIVRIDVIGTAQNYYSDVARTAVVGEPSKEQRRIYDLLLETHERILDMLRPGTRCSDAFMVYEHAMRVAGLPAYHFVGHGLGMTLHEKPFLNARTTDRLEEGMVLCIEPLTMIDGRFGMQVEDEVLVTADGCEPITHAGDLLRIGR